MKTILLNIGRVKIVGEAECGNDLLNLMDSQKADIVFVEVNMPKMNGIEVTRKAHLKFPDTTIIAFSSLENKRYIDQMLEAGAEGYLSKNCNNYDLFRQIIEDRHHGGFISPELQTRQMTDNNIN